MSLVAIRAALEQRLDAMTPALATAWENAPFTPTIGTPHQRVHLLPAEADNPEQSGGYIERGYLQVTLKYPLQAGTGAAAARAQLVRDQFPRALSLTSGGIVVQITRTPAIGGGTTDGDWWSVPIKIFWQAQFM